MRAVVSCLLFVTACGGYDDLALLELERIEPPNVEPGTTLRIHGNGFPLGRAPVLALRGSVHRPGAPHATVEMELAGQVRSDSLVEVPIGADVIEAVGGRSTFDGELRIGFRAADDLRDVFAVEHVRLDFLPDTAFQLRVEGADDETVEPGRFGDFGLTLSREELGTPGVRVVAVEAGGLAARQGVQPNDTVIGLDGLSVYGWRDFNPDPSRNESTVLVSRDGLRGVHALRWPHQATTPLADPFELSAFALLGLLLGWGSPIALLLRSRYAKLSPSVWAIRVGLSGALAALLLFVPALQWTTLWILALGTFAALFSLASRDRAGTVSLALAVGATLTVMLVRQTASVSEIIGAQGPELLRWHAFQSPASSFAFATYLYAVGVVSTGPRLSASLYAAAAAVFGAVLFLGGWPLVEPSVGVAIVGGKAIALLVAAGAVDLHPRAAARICTAALGLALVGWFADWAALSPRWGAMAFGIITALAIRAAVPRLREASIPVPA